MEFRKLFDILVHPADHGDLIKSSNPPHQIHCNYFPLSLSSIFFCLFLNICTSVEPKPQYGEHFRIDKSRDK